MSAPIKEAIKLHQSGNFAAAEKLYTELLAQEPNNPEILHLAGILAAQQENYQQAHELITRAITINPQSAVLHNSIGNVLRHLNQPENAIKHYTFALQLSPNNAVTHNNLAIIHQKSNHLSTAVTHYFEAIKLNPQYADARYNLGTLLLQQNTLKESALQFKTVITIQPNHAGAHCNLARIYQQENNVDNALKHYIKALRIEPHNIVAQHNLGSILIKKNKLPAAIRHFQKTLLLDPFHQEAFYNLGTAFLLQKQPENALKYFLRLAELTKDFDVYYNLGIVYTDINRLNEAINYFNEALKIKSIDFATHNNLGAIYLRLENSDKALLHYKKALESQPNNKEIKYIISALSQTDEIFTPSAPAEYIQHLFDQYAKNYDEHLSFLHYQAPQQLYDAVTEILNFTYIPLKTLDILDLGCGTGLCGEKFYPLANKLIGIDLSEKMLEIAHAKNIYTELKLGEIEDIVSQDIGLDSQDLILAADTLVYVGNLENIFAACEKTLKNNALFAFNLERNETHPYVLQQSGRFAHQQSYIIELAEDKNLRVLLCKEVNIRKHRENFTKCLLYVLQKIS